MSGRARHSFTGSRSWEAHISLSTARRLRWQVRRTSRRVSLTNCRSSEASPTRGTPSRSTKFVHDYSADFGDKHMSSGLMVKKSPPPEASEGATVRTVPPRSRFSSAYLSQALRGRSPDSSEPPRRRPHDLDRRVTGRGVRHDEDPGAGCVVAPGRRRMDAAASLIHPTSAVCIQLATTTANVSVGRPQYPFMTLFPRTTTSPTHPDGRASPSTPLIPNFGSAEPRVQPIGANHLGRGRLASTRLRSAPARSYNML
jgi:hypothetical protein